MQPDATRYLDSDGDGLLTTADLLLHLEKAGPPGLGSGRAGNPFSGDPEAERQMAAELWVERWGGGGAGPATGVSFRNFQRAMAGQPAISDDQWTQDLASNGGMLGCWQQPSGGGSTMIARSPRADRGPEPKFDWETPEEAMRRAAAKAAV